MAAQGTMLHWQILASSTTPFLQVMLGPLGPSTVSAAGSGDFERNISLIISCKAACPPRDELPRAGQYPMCLSTPAIIAPSLDLEAMVTCGIFM